MESEIWFTDGENYYQGHWRITIWAVVNTNNEGSLFLGESAYDADMKGRVQVSRRESKSNNDHQLFIINEL